MGAKRWIGDNDEVLRSLRAEVKRQDIYIREQAAENSRLRDIIYIASLSVRDLSEVLLDGRGRRLELTQDLTEEE